MTTGASCRAVLPDPKRSSEWIEDPAWRSQVLAWLLLCGDDWMVRRKLTIAVLDASWHRKQLSVDFRLPLELRSWAAEAGISAVPMPLTLLHKAPRATMDFDLRDGDGRSRSLPLLRETVRCNQVVLGAVVRQLLLQAGKPADEIGEVAEELLTAVGNPSAAEAALAAGYALRDPGGSLPDELANSSVFLWLAQRMPAKALVTCDLSVAEERQIIKLSFLDSNTRDSSVDGESGRTSIEEMAGWRPFVLRVVSDVWTCGAFHLEVDAPDDLEILTAEIYPCAFEHDPRTGRSNFPASGPPGLPILPAAGQVQPNGRDRAHLYAPRPGGLADVLQTVVTFRAARDGFVSTAAIITFVNAFLLAWVLVALGPIKHNSDASVSLVLVGLAGASVATTQVARHRLALHLLRIVRRALLLSGAAVLCALLWILLAADTRRHLEFGGVTVPEEVWVRIPLVACLLVALACFGIASLARKLPRDNGGRSRSQRWVQNATWALVKWLGGASIVD